MDDPLPFQLTADAVTYLKRQLRDQEPGREPVLITCLGFESRNRQGRVTEHYMGEHFGIAHYDIGQVKDAECIDLFGWKVLVIPDTLRRIRGRTLAIKQEIVGHGWFGKKKRKLLVTA